MRTRSGRRNTSSAPSSTSVETTADPTRMTTNTTKAVAPHDATTNDQAKPSADDKQQNAPLAAPISTPANGKQSTSKGKKAPNNSLVAKSKRNGAKKTPLKPKKTLNGGNNKNVVKK